MTLPCEFGGLPLLSAKISMALVGAWHADVQADADAGDIETNSDGTVTLLVDGVRFVGTVTRSTVIAGRLKAQVVGGRGGINGELDVAHYVNTSVMAVIRDILADAGEVLSDTTNTATIAVELSSWERVRAPASRALTRICDAAGLIWRVLADGSVWVGQESFPASDVEHVLIDEDWAAGLIEIAPEAPDLTPGVTLRDQQIRYVVHEVRRSGLRTHAYLESPGGLLDKFLAGIRQSVTYSRVYPCEVVKRNADGTLQLLPDDGEVRGAGLNNVPITPGLPGCNVNVPEGARCYLEFAAGDPSRPRVTAWDHETLLTVLALTAESEVVVEAPTTRINQGGGEVLIGNTPANPIGRVGDLVQITMALTVPDPTQGILLSSPVGPVTGTIGTQLLPVIAIGQIISGKDSAKA